jgi:hypothetical protein
MVFIEQRMVTIQTADKRAELRSGPIHKQAGRADLIASRHQIYYVLMHENYGDPRR